MRKLVSIAVERHEWIDERKGHSHWSKTLYGVADDGTLWRKVTTNEWEDEWEMIETIPED